MANLERNNATGSAKLSDSCFLRACRGTDHDHVPVWFMRQAGRSLPEYRSVRGSAPILETIQDPDLATEITLQPLRRYGVDAAILFSDIVVPAYAVGFGVTVTRGVGPEIEHPFRGASDLARLRPLEPDVDTPYVLATVRQLVRELEVPLIGFAGAPFTVASYLIEGGPSRNYLHTKSLMFDDERLWHSLLDRLADLAIASLSSQVECGATALQLFDSWAGALSADQYLRYAAPHSQKVFEALAATGVPKIHFGVNTSELLQQFLEVGADVVGVDWRTRLDQVRTRLGAEVVLQGNLDPAMVVAGVDTAVAGVREVLTQNAGHPGHIFNLGHGVLPQSNPDVLSEVVKVVHTEGVVNPVAPQR